MSETHVKDGLTTTEVASYLRRHPEFLSEYPDIALTLAVPRDQGATTSLASYQLDVLRDKNHELSRRLRDRALRGPEALQVPLPCRRGGSRNGDHSQDGQGASSTHAFQAGTRCVP